MAQLRLNYRSYRKSPLEKEKNLKGSYIPAPAGLTHFYLTMEFTRAVCAHGPQPIQKQNPWSPLFLTQEA